MYCIVIGLILLIAELVWIISAGAVPILSYSSFDKTGSIFKSKKFWLSGIIMVFSIFLLWFFAISPIRVELVEKAEVASNEIQQLYSDPSFPIFKPRYLPPRVVELSHEYVQNWGEYTPFPSTEYTRKYLYEFNSRKSNSFTIIQVKPQTILTDGEYFQKDYDSFLESSYYPSGYYQHEILTINGYPAYYTEFAEEKGSEIFIFREGTKIVISLKTGGNIRPLIPKEEMIKIAESLKKVN